VRNSLSRICHSIHEPTVLSLLSVIRFEYLFHRGDTIA
jgi:hypothetical protein